MARRQPNQRIAERGFAGLARPAKVAEDRAWRHRRELCRIAEQDQASRFWKLRQEPCHQLEVEHGTFIDDERVQTHKAAPTEQRVRRARGGHELCEFRNQGNQILHLPRHRLLQARCRLAGGSCEADAARVGKAEFHQQRDESGCHGGLAGAGTAGDDADLAAGRRPCGTAEFLAGVREHSRNGVPKRRWLPQQGTAGGGLEAFGHAPLCLEDAVQIEPVAVQDQGTSFATFGLDWRNRRFHDAAGVQLRVQLGKWRQPNIGNGAGRFVVG